MVLPVVNLYSAFKVSPATGLVSPGVVVDSAVAVPAGGVVAPGVAVPGGVVVPLVCVVTGWVIGSVAKG